MSDNLKLKVVHLTSAHPRYDTRIFLKECRSLAKNGYDVSLVVADGKGDELREGVSFYDVGGATGRLDRIFNVTSRVFDKAKELHGDIYHLHDPELIPIGLKLRKSGKKVVFDAHEDVPKQLLSKPYLNKTARWLLSKVFSVYESYACSRLNGIITATPFIRDKFLVINPCSVDINNYPMLGELAVGEIDWTLKENKVCYIGGIASIRGVLEVVNAMGILRTGTRLELGGEFSEDSVKQAAQADVGWSSVSALGFLSREQVRDVLRTSVGGLVTFHPVPNHIDAQPNKMFEYMSAGVPVIGSDFPLWKKIIEDNECGICVDPLEPRAIAKAIDYLVSSPVEAERMGRNGKAAVYDKYNWDIEETKLLGFYKKLADQSCKGST